MSTNAGDSVRRMKYVTQKTEQVNTLQKLDERVESMEEEEAIERKRRYMF